MSTTYKKNSMVAHSKTAKEDAIAEFSQDSAVASVDFLNEVVRIVVLPPFQESLSPLAPTLLTPLQNTVPEPLREFVDLHQVCKCQQRK